MMFNCNSTSSFVVSTLFIACKYQALIYAAKKRFLYCVYIVRARWSGNLTYRVYWTVALGAEDN